jgi:hypothetical protein
VSTDQVAGGASREPQISLRSESNELCSHLTHSIRSKPQVKMQGTEDILKQRARLLIFRWLTRAWKTRTVVREKSHITRRPGLEC